jgi:hypothetical protein
MGLVNSLRIAGLNQDDIYEDYQLTQVSEKALYTGLCLIEISN